MEFYFVLAAFDGFDAGHTNYEYAGNKLHTSVVEARKEAKRVSRESGVRAYVAKLVTRYKPGETERKDY